MGQLVYDRADLCASGLGMNVDRTRVLDFSMGLLPTPYTLVVRNNVWTDEEAFISYRSYISLFNNHVWLALAAFGFCFSLWLKLHFNSLEIHNSLSYPECLSMFCLSLMQLNGPLGFSHVSPTYVHWLMNLFGMIVYIAYSCYLTADLTTGQSDKFPDNYTELIDEGYMFYVETGGLQEILIRQSLGELGADVFDRHVKLFNYPLDGDMGPIIGEMLAKPKQVHFGTTLHLTTDRRLKVLKSFKGAVQKFANLAYRKDSEITDLFNFHLTKIAQSGALDKIKQRWLEEDRPTDDMTQRIFVEDSKPIGYESMVFPGAVLVVSTVLALFVLLLETYKKRGRKYIY